MIFTRKYNFLNVLLTKTGQLMFSYTSDSRLLDRILIILFAGPKLKFPYVLLTNIIMTFPKCLVEDRTRESFAKQVENFILS